MTVVMDVHELPNEQRQLMEIKEWIVTEYDYRDRFKHNPDISYLENLRFDVEELIDYLNDNFCLIGYYWTIENGKLEYVYESIH